MKNLRYYKPFELSQLFDQVGWSEPSGVQSRMPAVDVKETEEAYGLLIDLPGVKKDAISISYKNGHLSIEAKREVSEENATSWVCRERYAGGFQRNIYLSQSLKDDEISASLNDGVLEIYAPKQHQTKQISIN